MNDLTHLVNNYTVKQEKLLKKICSPLEIIGVPFFVYYSIDKKGNFGTLSNYTEQVEFYYSEKLYLKEAYLSSPTLFRSGFTLKPLIPSPNYWDLCYTKFQASHMLLIQKTHGELLEGFIFSAPGINKDNVQVLVQQINLLEKFTHYFKREAASLIGNMLAEGYSVLKEKGESFFHVPENLPLTIEKKNIEHFLNAILPLTKREHQCLELFKQGRSAQAVASILNISQRTVEHHYDSIRDKLGVQSKWDLLNY